MTGAAALAAAVRRDARRADAARTLLLDLDGTLAPIAPTPEAARVPGATLETLRRLVRAGWTVAIVSGRPAAELRRMVPVRGVRYFGSHGAEGAWTPGGRRTLLDPAVRRSRAALGRRAGALLSGYPEVRLERKPAGLAFHDRALGGPRLRAWRRRLRSWLERQDLSGFEIIRGKRVVELRPRGVDKGAVVRAMPRGIPRRRGDASLVAIGDDRTDEDLFRALGGRGLTIRVGRTLRGSAARHRLPSVRAVADFLARLAAPQRNAANAAS